MRNEELILECLEFLLREMEEESEYVSISYEARELKEKVQLAQKWEEL